MANRVRVALDQLRAQGRRGLMPFITGGFPSLSCTAEAIVALGDTGVAAIEVGIPFSDPIADGPVIAQSMHEALERGADCTRVLDAVRRARARTEVPLVAMVSASIVFRRGGPSFIGELSDAGFDGVIIPDIDLTAIDPIEVACKTHDLTLSLLVASTTSAVRTAELARHCRGFIYLLARAGLTGEQAGTPDIAGPVARLRGATTLPIAAGFGISTASHVAAVCAHADAAIVGSAFVRRMGGADAVEQAVAFTRELAAGLPRPSSAATPR